MKENKAYCRNCGEERYNALCKTGVHTGYCFNCSYEGDKFNRCTLCDCVAPYEMHHLVPQCLNAQSRQAETTMPLCLNCHKCITISFARLKKADEDTDMYSMTKSIVDAKRLFFRIFEEREQYYANRQRRDYKLLARAYQQDLLSNIQQFERESEHAEYNAFDWKDFI